MSQDLRSNQQTKKQNKNSFLASNPVLRRLNKVEERSEQNTATFGGIAGKTVYFLLFCVVGILAQLIVAQYLAVGDTMNLNYKGFEVTLYTREVIVFAGVAIAGVVFQLIAVFARATTPFTGALFCISQGYFISFLIFKVLAVYQMEYLGALALVITVLIVLIMAILYATGAIRVTKKFKMVMTTLFFTMIGTALVSVIGWLIPFTRQMVTAIQNNFVFSVVSSVIFIIIASLFLICDFDTIDHVVHDKLPKKYEWSAAFGLAFTVIWLYLKVLDLIITIAGKNKS